MVSRRSRPPSDPPSPEGVVLRGSNDQGVNEVRSKPRGQSDPPEGGPDRPLGGPRSDGSAPTHPYIWYLSGPTPENGGGSSLTPRPTPRKGSPEGSKRDPPGRPRPDPLGPPRGVPRTPKSHFSGVRRGPQNPGPTQHSRFQR